VLLHNRLTHSLKVSELAKTMAENLDHDDLDPDVVEAAGLAHDLGHPPFGHNGEAELDRLLRDNGVTDGFEGNAQTLRIVTKLACRHPVFPGFDLTRATLSALIKNPNLRAGDKLDTGGAYLSEAVDFRWALGLAETDMSAQPTVEAQLADIADDITFSLHDVDDFYRARLLTMEQLAKADPEYLLASWAEHRHIIPTETDRKAWQEASVNVATVLQRPDRKVLLEMYRGTREQRGLLQAMTSHFLDRWTVMVEVRSGDIHLDPTTHAEIQLIKQFVWRHVIERPQLARQQEADRGLLQRLFLSISRWLDSEQPPKSMPVALREMLTAAVEDPDVPLETQADLDRLRVRAAGDYIASLPERQARWLDRSLHGPARGTVDGE
jgi:dGTPase